MISGNNQTGRKYRFLFTTFPGYGHFHPVVPTAVKLKEAGHEVAFAVARDFCPAVEQAGFEAFAAGLNGQEDPEFQEILGQLAQMPPGPESEMAVMLQVFANLNPRRLIPDMLAIAEKWKPDMIIWEAAAYGGGITAEYLGLPQASISPSTFLEGLQFYDQKAAPVLEGVRKDWGLNPDPDGRNRYPQLLINFTPPSFALSRPGPVYPPTSQFFRPRFFDRWGEDSLPEWVSSLPDRPTIYVTLGTIVNEIPGFYPRVIQTILAGLRDEPYNLIVTLGRDKDPADFGPQPGNVHIERYIPQTLLMPHLDLMIMHGGSNSLLLAIDRSLPVVIIPLAADQFMNAQRCTELNLSPVIQLNELTPDAVRAATREVLENRQYRENLQRLQTELHSLPEIEQAVALLEELAARNYQTNPGNLMIGGAS